MLKKRHPKIFQNAKALQKIESFKRHDPSRSQNSVRVAHLCNLTEELRKELDRERHLLEQSMK